MSPKSNELILSIHAAENGYTIDVIEGDTSPQCFHKIGAKHVATSFQGLSRKTRELLLEFADCVAEEKNRKVRAK